MRILFCNLRFHEYITTLIWQLRRWNEIENVVINLMEPYVAE